MAASIRSFALAFALFIILPQTVWAAPKPVLGVSVAPSSATAGLSNTLTFTFTATDAGNGTASIVVPPSASKAPWSAPQVSNSALAGYVAVQAGSCASAGPVSISGSSIQVKFKCTPGKMFKVVYGSGTAKTNAAQLPGGYTFTTQVNAGAGSAPVPVQPIVTVNPGRAASVKLTGLADAIAGTPQAGTVTAFDAFGNVATSYGGTLHFTTNDTKATPPADTAASGGQASFNIALKTAGNESLTATDIANSTLKDTATVKITAGGISSISVGISPTLFGYPSPSLPAFPGDGGAFTSCGASPLDAYGNAATFSGNLSWTSTDPYAKLPGCSAPTGCGTPVPVAIYFMCMFGTQGHQTITVTDPVSGISGDKGITVIGPTAQPDTLSIVDPTHNATSLYTVNPLDNDDQTSGLTGNTLLGVFTNTIKTVTQQARYTDEHGVMHQVGVMRPTADGTMIAWEMNPPTTMMLPTPGLVYDACPPAPTTSVCHIASPITAKYTIFDGVNESEPGTITIQMDTPDTPQVAPSETIAIYRGGVPTGNGGSTPVTVSVPGQGSVQVPVLERAMNVTTTPTGLASTYSVSMTFNSPVVLSGACDPRGCPNTVTLTGTAVLPDSFMASASGSSVNASLQPFLLYQPLNDIWHAGPYDNTFGMFGPATGFLPVTLQNGNASNPAPLPAGYAGLFGFMTLSCQNATIDVNCPMPNIAVAGATLYDSVTFEPSMMTPQGCTTASVLGAVGEEFPVGVTLDYATSDAGGNIHVTIWPAHDQGSCTTNPDSDIRYWSLDGTSNAVQADFDIPVHGSGIYSRSWTPTSAGAYFIRATYSGDYNNTTNSTPFKVFKVE